MPTFEAEVAAVARLKPDTTEDVSPLTKPEYVAEKLGFDAPYVRDALLAVIVSGAWFTVNVPLACVIV